MGLLRYLRGEDVLEDSSSNGKDEARTFPRPDNELPLLSAYVSSPIAPSAALAIADVWSAVRVLCDSAASLPLHVYRKRDDGGRDRVTSGKLVELLDRPGLAMTQADLVSQLMCHVLIWGAAYLAKYRQGDEITQLGLLHPELVRPEAENGRLRFRYTPGGEAPRFLYESDLVFIRGFTVDGVTGLSPVTQAADVLGLSRELVKHALSYFAVSDAGGVPRPAGLLKVSPGMGEEGRQRQLEGLRAESRSHGILVVEGEADYQDIASNMDDAQFEQQRRLVAAEVARAFRIPPHMIGAPTSDSLTYSTVEQQSLDFVRYSLAPLLRKVELAISHDGDLTFDRQFVRFEVDALLRPDSAGRAAFYEKARDPVTGWLEDDEVRRLEDLPPRHKPPAQAQTIEQMLARPQGVAANGDRQQA
jgi:HK97 family phage portal protein